MPLPGTPAYNSLKEKGRFIPNWDIIGDQEAFNFNYADMARGRFERLYMIARITTVLPINLFYFVKYNLSNPVRLFKMIVTQFNSVLIKLARSLAKVSHE